MRRPVATFLARAFIQLLGWPAPAGSPIAGCASQDRSVWLYRGGFIVVAASTVGLLISCADARRGPLARLLAFPPLRYIGAISYGLYLYHWPLFQLLTHARIQQHGAALLGIRFAATFAVAIVSYHLFEQPIRRGALSRAPAASAAPRWLRPAVLPVIGLAVVAGLIAG